MGFLSPRYFASRFNGSKAGDDEEVVDDLQSAGDDEGVVHVRSILEQNSRERRSQSSTDTSDHIRDSVGSGSLV